MLNGFSLVDFVTENIRKNAMGVEVLFSSEVTGLKKGTAKNRSEAYLRFYDEENKVWNVRKETRYVNVTLGRDYTASVENRSENEEDYATEKPKGKFWVHYPYLLQADNSDTQYLRIAENKNTQRKTTYFVGDREATAEELEIIKAHLPQKNYTCQKQINYGVAEDYQAVVKDFTLSKIKYVKFGEKKLVA